MAKPFRNKVLIAGTALLAFLQPLKSQAEEQTNDMFGVWGSITLRGDFTRISPDMNHFQWLVMNQTRTREDSPKGSRLSENLLFGQLGYNLNDWSSLWVGYTHNWLHPLDRPNFEESRPYADWFWTQNPGDFKIIGRTRFEFRINQATGDDGYRARQLLQVSHALPFLPGLSAYLGDEVLFYMNENNWGKQGFSENRILSGLSYKLSDHFNLDLGYMGQYVDTKAGANLFTHNLQANIGYSF